MDKDAELKNISINSIKPNPENPRIVFRQEDLDKLLTSILKIGLQVPITVYKESNDSFVIIDGERRWKTFLKLNYEKIPAIIQPKPTELDNLLLMFNIHSLREQWDVFTIANKLTRVINLLEQKLGRPPREAELSEETGLSRGILRRCKLILDLPDRFKQIILTEIAKPKSEQKFSEDFFLEMEQSLKTVAKNFPGTVQDIDSVRDVLIDKYRENIINNITDFRKLTKIATSFKNVDFSIESIEEALGEIFTNNKISIDHVYRNTVESLYGERKLYLNINTFWQKIQSITPDDLYDTEIRDSLIKIKNYIDDILSKEV